MKVSTAIACLAIIIFQLTKIQVESAKNISKDQDVCKKAQDLHKEVALKINIALQPHWPEILHVRDELRLDALQAIELGHSHLDEFTKVYQDRMDNLKMKCYRVHAKCWDDKKEQMQNLEAYLGGELRDCVTFHRHDFVNLDHLSEQILYYVHMISSYNLDKNWAKSSYCKSCVEDFERMMDELPGKLEVLIDRLKEAFKTLKADFSSCNRDKTGLYNAKFTEIVDSVERCCQK